MQRNVVLLGVRLKFLLVMAELLCSTFRLKPVGTLGSSAQLSSGYCWAESVQTYGAA
jgi:hypothetical protein